jgi:chromosome segregation ATPase
MRRGATLIVLLFGVTPALAQDSPEARLRDLLRRTTTELRAAQDSQASLQALLDQEKQKTATLQKKIDDLTADEAARQQASAEDAARIRAAAQAQVTALQASLKQWQDAYQKAAELARAKDAEGKSIAARATESQQQLDICSSANTRLIAVAGDILHLYQTQSFRSLLLGSYEPLLGLKKVELENTVQDYEDKIADHKYSRGQPATVRSAK